LLIFIKKGNTESSINHLLEILFLLLFLPKYPLNLTAQDLQGFFLNPFPMSPKNHFLIFIKPFPRQYPPAIEKPSNPVIFKKPYSVIKKTDKTPNSFASHSLYNNER